MPAVPRRRPRRALAFAAALAVLAAAQAGAEEPRPGETVPVPGTGWSYRYEAGVAGGTLHLADGGGRQADYRLDGCGFCSGGEDNCAHDGLFALRLVAAPAEPVVVAVCHVGAHSQQAAVLAPLRDARAPVLTVTGRYSVVARPVRDGLRVEHDEQADGARPRRVTVLWPPRDTGAEGDGATRAPDWRRPPPPAPRDAGVGAAVAALAGIVRRRDADGLRALLAPDVLVSFGGDGGPAEFVERWDLASAPRTSAVWEVLAALLRHNPAVERDDGAVRIVFPYYFATWPHDGYGHRFVHGSGVALRAGPHDRAPVLDRLGFEAVMDPGAAEGWEDVADMLAATAEADEVPGRWAPVITRTGLFGYVDRGLAPGIVGYRLSMTREDGGDWRIDMLVAGD